MPRGRKPAAKMNAEPTPVTYTLTESQFDLLKRISEQLAEARHRLEACEDAETHQAVSFQAGRAYSLVDQAEDAIDEVINSFVVDIDWSEDDDDL